jgi:hypothetical protein
MLSGGRDQTYHKSAETVDDSNARFHFEDPEVGDYFVVSIFEDPEYQTPLFVNNGGASSCAWEVETAHRTSPNLELEYVGPMFLPANNPAIFKVTLKNYRYYYENTAVSPERGTDMWASSSLGYGSHDYTLHVDTSDVANGLAVSIGGANLIGNGLLFFSFGKKSVEVMVEVRRGLAAYEYPSPSLYFEELCVAQAVGSHFGEKATPMKLNNMPFGSGDVGIQFYRPCPSLLWSADHAESTKFAISQSSPTIDLQALVNTVGGITDDPGFAVGNNAALHDDGYTQDPDETTIRFTTQFRQAGETVWTDVLDETSALTYQRVGINPLVTGTLHVENAITTDGDWELRLEADCYAPVGAGTGRDAFDKSYTPILAGTVDWTRPEVVAVTTTSGSTLLTVADMVYVIYSETIDCSRAYGRLTFGASTSSPVTLATAGPQRLRMGCDGPKLWVSMIKPSSTELAAGPVTILVTDVTDLAGNPADVARDEWNAALREAAALRNEQEEALQSSRATLDGAQRSLAAAEAVEAIVAGYANSASRHQQRRRHARQLPSSAGLYSARERRALGGISFLVSERVAKEAQLDVWVRSTQSNVSAADVALLTAEIEQLLEAELGVDTDQWSIELVAVQSERENLTAVVGELDVVVKRAQQTLAQLKREEAAAQSDSNRLVSSANSANSDASADDSERNRDDIYALLTGCMFFTMLIFAIQVVSVYSSRTASRGRVGAQVEAGAPAKESSAEDAEVEILRAEVERLRVKLQADMSVAASSVADGALDSVSNTVPSVMSDRERSSTNDVHAEASAGPPRPAYQTATRRHSTANDIEAAVGQPDEVGRASRTSIGADRASIGAGRASIGAGRASIGVGRASSGAGRASIGASRASSGVGQAMEVKGIQAEVQNFTSAETAFDQDRVRGISEQAPPALHPQAAPGDTRTGVPRPERFGPKRAITDERFQNVKWPKEKCFFDPPPLPVLRASANKTPDLGLGADLWAAR